tara:strand:+ start:133 stop:843 length:711 start_codon:yes stop_codon:yes gene_type:complete
MKGWALICCAMLVPSVALAEADVVRSITVHGTAERDIVPDVAHVQVSVREEHKELREVKKQADAKLSKLLDVLDDYGVAKEDIATQYASIQPQYRYVDSRRVFQHYLSNTSVDVTVRDVESVGALLQKLVEAEFEHIGNVHYALDNPTRHKDAVLVDALENARAKAEEMAGAYNVGLGDVISIQEGMKDAQTIQPKMMHAEMAMSARSAGSMDAVSPPMGQINVTGHVTVTFELEQ